MTSSQRPANPLSTRRSSAGQGHVVWLSAPAQSVPDETKYPRNEPPMPGPSLLSMPGFMDHLRWEMHRTNRSGSAFSIAIFATEKGVQNNRSTLCDLSLLLQKRLRSTDILGWYGTKAVAALLLDTNHAGTEKFAKMVVAESGLNGLEVTIRTYPDQSIEWLSAGALANTSETISDGLHQFAANPECSLWKRTLDVIGSIVASVALSPVMLITAVIIKVTSPGPIIFKQTRLGFRGSPFVLLKFRSMSVDSDDQTHRDYAEQFISNQLSAAGQQAHGMPTFKMVADPRVTPFGDFIRKTSIDELPQLLNVLKGEMSLVGPRPPLAYEVEKYKPWHLRRILDVRPGMTGLWQVEGRSTTSFDDMVRLDLKYIDHWSLLLDMRILLKTVKVVLSCKGAH